MAYDEDTAERLRRTLPDEPDRTERKMMGAICFMTAGNMCCGVTGTALMIRVGRDVSEQTLAEEYVRPMEIAGRRTSGFVLVDPPGLRTEAALARWVLLALGYVSTLPPKLKT